MAIILCVLPGFALRHLPAWLEWPYLAGLMGLASIVSYLAYRSDKRRAEAGSWRIPESTLHLVDLLGGWPGGLIAQRQYRHKIAKTPFQVVFWLTIVGYQYAAVELLTGGSITTYLLAVAQTALR
jgi:uncharacterized membrane protein YsdA (DUF1294 family)